MVKNASFLMVAALISKIIGVNHIVDYVCNDVNIVMLVWSKEIRKGSMHPLYSTVRALPHLDLVPLHCSACKLFMSMGMLCEFHRLTAEGADRNFLAHH